MKEVKILCDGGLGNRLNSLIGGLCIAEDLNADPIIYWPENNWCGCSFNDLYLGHNIRTEGLTTLFTKNLNSIFLIHDNQTKLVLPIQHMPSQEVVDRLKSTEDSIVYFNSLIPNFIQKKRVIEKLKALVIQPNILEKANKFIEDHAISANTRGFMFRKTDYLYNPKMKLNDDALYAYMLDNSDKSFYVCSDDQATESRFSYITNVHIYPKTSYVEKYQEGSWTDTITDSEGRTMPFNVNRPRQSVLEALIALLILSHTNISVHVPSTFLDYAKYYNIIWRSNDSDNTF